VWKRLAAEQSVLILTSGNRRCAKSLRVRSSALLRNRSKTSSSMHGGMGCMVAWIAGQPLHAEVRHAGRGRRHGPATK
jgi:hypothetical protein